MSSAPDLGSDGKRFTGSFPDRPHSSEKIDRAVEQLELALEDIETAVAEKALLEPVVRTELPKSKPFRQPLPEDRPCHEVVHELKECSFPTGGGQDFLKAGTSIVEVLDYVPASFRVVRHVQPRFVCKGCDTELLADMPSLPIARGKPGAGLVAHFLIAKYCDHLPLCRQSEIYAYEGIELGRSTMADWVGKASVLLEPLNQQLHNHVFAGQRLHGDDTCKFARNSDRLRGSFRVQKCPPSNVVCQCPDLCPFDGPRRAFWG